MNANSYANQIRQVREQERRRDKDFTDQAMTLLSLRLASIDRDNVPEEVKQRRRTAAMSQWQVFMGREIPANG